MSRIFVHIGARRKGADNSGQFYIDTTSTGSSIEAFVIDPNGNVGIWTTAP